MLAKETKMKIVKLFLKVRIYNNLIYRSFGSAAEATNHAKAKIEDRTTKREKQTHLRLETVDENERSKKAYKIFENVANKYDIMCDVQTLGIHRIWRDIFINRLAPSVGTNLLDVASGTGETTFRYLNYLKNYSSDKNLKQSKVTVCDINQAMLNVGKVRADRLGYNKANGINIEWLCSDAENLNIPDDTHTAYTISFGIRHCTCIEKVLSEAYRVLKPGGRFMCLELSHLENEGMQWAYDKYLFQENFKTMIENAGFQHVAYENLTFGICSIHSGFKI